MSVGIFLSELSEDTLNNIKSLLTIKPNESFFQKKYKKYKKYSKNNEESEKGVVEFWITDSDVIYIPYYFYAITFKVRPNISKITYGFYPQANFNFTKSLYDSQIIICRDMLEHLTLYGTANLNIFTSGGKTVMCAYTSSVMKLKTLVLISNTVLSVQWINTYKEFTNAKIYSVEGIGDPPIDTDIVICMYTRIHYLSKKFLFGVGMLIIDEAHTFCSISRVQALLSTQPKYIVAATATLEREADGMHSMILSMCGLHRIFKKSEKPFNVVLYNTGCDVDIPYTRFGDPDWTNLVNRLCKDEERNQLIVDIIKGNLQHKILVLTLRQEHVSVLHDKLVSLSISCDYMTGRKKKYNDSKVLIGTVKKIGTGFDEKMSCEDFSGINIDLLIIAISIKSTGLLQQVSGRVFRAQFPNIIGLYDDNPISEKHMAKNEKWFKSVNGNVVYLESPKCSKLTKVDPRETHLAKVRALEGIK